MVPFFYIFGTESRSGVTPSICTPKQVKYCPGKVTPNKLLSFKVVESRSSQNTHTPKSRYLLATCLRRKHAPRESWAAAAVPFALWQTKWQDSAITSKVNNTTFSVGIRLRKQPETQQGPHKICCCAKNMLQSPYVLMHKANELRCSI